MTSDWHERSLFCQNVATAAMGTFISLTSKNDSGLPYSLSLLIWQKLGKAKDLINWTTPVFFEFCLPLPLSVRTLSHCFWSSISLNIQRNINCFFCASTMGVICFVRLVCFRQTDIGVLFYSGFSAWWHADNHAQESLLTNERILLL